MKWIKRIFISLIILIALAVLILWTMGHRSGAGTFEVSVMIKRPPSVVYAALTNDHMTKRWVSGIIKLEELTPPPTHVGTKIILTEKINGSIVKMEEEVIALKPDHYKKYISRGLGSPSEQFTEYGEYLLEEKDGGTLFTMKSKNDYHGFLMRLIEPLITPMVRAKFEGDQKTLKAILEEEPIKKPAKHAEKHKSKH